LVLWARLVLDGLYFLAGSVLTAAVVISVSVIWLRRV
jgi:hypothetical protein